MMMGKMTDREHEVWFFAFSVILVEELKRQRKGGGMMKTAMQIATEKGEEALREYRKTAQGVENDGAS